MGAIIGLLSGAAMQFSIISKVALESSPATLPFAATNSNMAVTAVAGMLKGISFGSPSSVRGDGTFGLHLMTGVKRNNTEGNPSPPCLEIYNPNMWRFKWSVGGGLKNITVKCKQIINENPRPTMIIKANPEIGLLTDISGSAPSSTEWTEIGPVSFVSSASGSVWVELHNNLDTRTNAPAYFDHIVVS